MIEGRDIWRRMCVCV